MKRVWCLLLCIFLISAYAPSQIKAQEAPIYSLSDFTNREILAVYPDLHTELYSYPSDQALSEAYQALSHDPSIAWIQPNFSYQSTASLTNDALISEQWALYNDGSFSIQNNRNRYPIYQNPFAFGQYRAPFNGISAGFYPDDPSISGVDINMRDAWQVYAPKTKAVVALIDTGVDFSHPELRRAAWVNTDEIPNNGVDDDHNGYIDDYNGYDFYDHSGSTLITSDDNHGTHCAGTIAASTGNRQGISGIAGDGSVSIMSLKALGGSTGAGTTDTIVEAIRYAEANGANLCNLSLCTENYDRLFYQAIQSSNMLFVVAAGNGVKDTSYAGYSIDEHRLYPASFPGNNILSVANLSPSGALHYSSCYGKASVDLAAPGTSILSTTTDAWYSYMTGTSMAAPMVSGVCAMLFAEYPYLSAEEARAIIIKSTTPSEKLRGLVSTGGYLSAGKALRFANETYSPLYRDIKGVTGQDEIITASQNGWLSGVGNGLYSPNTAMTRAMAVTVLYRYAGSPEVMPNTAFYDVSPNEWYAKAVSWAEGEAITTGFPDGSFRPDQPLSREQMAAFFHRYYKVHPHTTLPLATLSFDDADAVAPWALESVRWATSTHAFAHLGRHLAPEHFASRAEMAIMLVRMSEIRQ